MAKNQIRQKTALKTTLRLTLVAAATAVSGLVVLLIIVFNLSKEEEGRAASSMTFKQATTFQDTTGILRGSINQKVIGVIIETSGKGTPVRVNSMTFTAKGTSVPVGKNIENARLWYTGNDPDFNLSQTVGTTLAEIGEKSMVFSAGLNLLPGKNYFWFTVDVKPDAVHSPGVVDAACAEIRIGAIAYLPVISDPIGKRFIQANVPYFSMGNLALGKVNSWNSKRDGSGTPPKSMQETRNSYFIQAGHRMISATGSNLQTLVIEKGGELKITSPLRLNAMYVACGGVVQMDTTIEDYYSFNEMYMDNGAMYIHNNTGKFPGLKCTFSPKSNQVFFRYGEDTFDGLTSYGNLVIDAMRGGDLDLGGKLTTVMGDFEIRRTGQGTRGVYFTGNNLLNVGGSFVMTGGSFSGAESGILNLSIEKNLVVKGGTFADVTYSAKSSSGLKLGLQTDVILLGGSFTTALSPSSITMFSGEGISRWVQKEAGTARLGNTTIGARHSLQIKGELFATIAKDRTFTVGEGAEMLCESVEIKGDGSFLLSDKATLGIGHTEGIYSKGDFGNIRTAKRQFHSGATYYYYTETQPQQTGVFETFPRRNSVYRLVLNKTQPSQVLNLSQNLSVEGQCKVNLGDIRNNGFELRLSTAGGALN